MEGWEICVQKYDTEIWHRNLICRRWETLNLPSQVRYLCTRINTFCHFSLSQSFGTPFFHEGLWYSSLRKKLRSVAPRDWPLYHILPICGNERDSTMDSSVTSNPRLPTCTCTPLKEIANDLEMPYFSPLNFWMNSYHLVDLNHIPTFWSQNSEILGSCLFTVHPLPIFRIRVRISKTWWAQLFLWIRDCLSTKFMEKWRPKETC